MIDPIKTYAHSATVARNFLGGPSALIGKRPFRVLLLKFALSMLDEIYVQFSSLFLQLTLWGSNGVFDPLIHVALEKGYRIRIFPAAWGKPVRTVCRLVCPASEAASVEKAAIAIAVNSGTGTFRCSR
jgi:hypothetical protein